MKDTGKKESARDRIAAKTRIRIPQIILIYALFALAWITFSDVVINAVVADPAKVMAMSIGKGWLFVAVTSLMLYGLMRRLFSVIIQLNEDLSSTLNAIPDLLFDIDREGIYLDVRGSDQAQLERQKMRLVGHSIHEVLPAEAANTIQSAIVEADRDGVSCGHRIFVEVGQATKCFELSMAKKRVAKGQKPRYVMLSRDVSERQRTELSLRKLSLAVEQSPESIMITDLNANIEYVNDALVRISGYPREELIGQTASMFNSGAALQATQAELWQTLLAGKTWKGEFSNRRKDGTEYQELAIITPLRQVDGRITHYVAVKEDVTEIKETERELARHRDHLEELVVSRTTELIRAKEQAEMSTRATSSFLANMSHEIRTPLNAIVGLTHILRRKEHEPDEASKLEKISYAADHLLDVINGILDLSKIESGKLVLEHVDFELDSMLARISSMVADRIREKGLELIVDAPVEPIVLNGDATRLGQALLNYLSNAVKFTETGSITLRVRILEESAGNVVLRFEVIDTGIGIEAADLPRVFHSFEQADSTTTRRFGGTGLGLSITRQLAQLMGGATGVSSRLGSGSTFWMTACLTRVHRKNGRYLINELCGRRALVVDDENVTCLVQSQLLRLTGLEGETATSGKAGLAMIETADREGKPFDLVLIDLLMENMDGFETLRALRALPLQRQPVALLVTASSNESIFDDAQRTGFDDILLKPLSATVLHASLVGHRAKICGETGNDASPETSAADITTRLQRDHANTHLLLVDDDLLNQEVAIILLEQIGFAPDIAENGQQAVEFCKENRYQLILMDMQMPVMDGLEATRQIRQLPHGQEMPIIAMTANAFTDDRSACIAAGMDDFVTKPVDPDVFYGLLLKWLSAGRH